ncbi:alpha-L-rhamnosidase [Novosphingobium gossypii]|uniref:alpha-L-rhamnosidase n=1 Tax=Novosphingobium gossypii TaxID=1604774 RepID=UPI003D24D2EA
MTGLDRRALLKGAGVLGAAAGVPLQTALGQERQSLRIVDLKTEGLVDPIGLDQQDVRLSWRLESERRGVTQVRCEVQAACTRALLEAGTPDLWHAGEVLTRRSMDMGWLGAPLKSRQKVYWRVLVRDDAGVKATSPVATFEMGLLDKADWTAQWIEAQTDLERADRAAGLVWMRGDRTTDESPRFFRLAFDLDHAGEATLFTAANFKSTLWLDGEQVQVPVGFKRFGIDPVAVTVRNLPAGRHVLGFRVENPRGFNGPKIHEIAATAMIRVGDRRITSEAMRTALHAGDGWSTVAFDDAGWDKAARSANQPQAWPRVGAYMLRREFRLAKPVRQARLRMTALGAYVAQINGQPVGEARLAPESSDFRFTALYRTYDVTRLLRAGANAIGAMLGEGWYGSYHAPAGRYAFGDPPLRLFAQLEVEHTDGTRTLIATDKDWQLRPESPVTQAEIYYGEDYDARLEQPGWSQPGFNAPGWVPAHIGATPPCALVSHVAPPLQAIERMTPRTITSFEGDRHVIDFGQNFAGWVELKAKGASGQQISLKFAEILGTDGRVDQANLRSARCACLYTLRGDPAGETYQPHFTYFGFRYVEVSGLGRAPTADEVTGIVVSSALPETGRPLVENRIVQGLWQNSRWSQRSNFFGVPTDCPQRDERLGWTGDANVFWDAAAFTMDVGPFTRRFMGDMRDAQGPRGEFPDYAPSGWRDQLLGASPGWADAGVILPWTVWQRYGDTAIVERNWAAMTRYMRFIAQHNPDHVWRNLRGYDYGDWVALDAKEPGDETTPKDLIATAMWKRSADAMAQMATGARRQPEAERYAQLSNDIAAAFAAAFVRPDGSVGNGSQCGYILALRFGLVPATLQAAATQKLAADIGRRGTLLSTGFLGTPFSLDALADQGQHALVYDLLLRTAFPSWGYMIAKGATTIWERWNADMADASMNSYNHYALGAVAGFVFRRIAGIDPLEAGFLKWRFDPVLDPRLNRGGATYDSVVGRIVTDWTYKSGRFEARITVPANSRAEVCLPARSADAVREGGKAVADAPDVKVIGLRGQKFVVEVGSGDYRFTVA